MTSIKILRKMKYILVFLTLAINSAFLAFSQSGEKRIDKYSPDFEFKNGIYLDFSNVKMNNPLPSSRIVSEIPHDDPSFYDKLMSSKKVTYFDDFGVQQTLSSDDIWGFSRNGIIYIKIGNGFSRVTIIGGICHFVADITTYSSRYNDPYNYYPYSNYPYSYSPYGYNRYGYSPGNYSTSEMKQYLIDFETGKVMEYNEKNLSVLLMKDPELHDEYVSLRKKKQKQLKFLYIRKYNEKNPIYFPSDK